MSRNFLRNTTIGRATTLFVGVWWLTSAAVALADTRPPVSYGRDIRPILSDKCFRCHGPDAETREADLRLDTREGVTSTVVVPGDPDKSEIIRRIFSDDDDVRMPPPDSKRTLSPEQKELLRRWVAEGAPFAEHWAFQPLPDDIAVPQVKDATWPREPLDNFVLARLESEKLPPTPRAAPLRLLRRITLDLTGLPPTPDECREFDNIDAAQFDAKYEIAVDRLLASPAFGEHMAVAWLDAARYADSYGYQSDQLNTQWPYRDWVVRALNDNLPYDKFLTWQLAGDLLPNATRDQRLATAFNRIHRMTNEGGTIAEEARIECVSDRIHTLGTAVLGLTVECCRCHDHKYDPLTMRDYYSLTAFFNSIKETGMYGHGSLVPAPSILLPTPEQEKQLAAARKKLANAEAAFEASIDGGGRRLDAWLEAPEAAGDSPVNSPDLVGYFSFDGPLNRIKNEAANGKGAATAGGAQQVPGIRGKALRFNGDDGAEFSDIFAIDRWDAFTLDFWMRDEARNEKPVVVLHRTYGSDAGYNGFELLLENGLLEVRMQRGWPGIGIGVRAKTPLSKSEWQHVAITYDGSSKARGLKLFVGGRELATDVLEDHIYKKAVIATYGNGHFTLGQRFRDRGFRDGSLDELRVYSRALAPLEVQNLDQNGAIQSAMADPEEHRGQLAAYYFSAIDEPARQAAQAVRDAWHAMVEFEEPLQEVPVMDETPEPRPTYILARGAYDAPKTDDKLVGRDTFSKILIPFPEDAPRNRLGLAQWLTDPRHPLTARVFVNRMWANFFGRGLVTTPENFGQQGALPTYPELLDWLARDFINHGWDVKHLCRMIALSATYQQDSRCPADLRSRDPENQLLARGPSHRLSGEQIRDVALAASGLLDCRMGGPPVSPYQPGPDLWRESNTMSPAYHQSTGKDLYRRSVYSVWKRTAPLPNMLAFDLPTREVCTVSRSRTNTPLQALVLLNDVQFVEAARALATLVSESNPDANQQIDAAFVRLAGRHPDATELALLTDLYNEQIEVFTNADQTDAARFLRTGESKVDSKLPPTELAALTVVCQAILNLDATIVER